MYLCCVNVFCGVYVCMYICIYIFNNCMGFERSEKQCARCTHTLVGHLLCSGTSVEWLKMIRSNKKSHESKNMHTYIYRITHFLYVVDCSSFRYETTTEYNTQNLMCLLNKFRLSIFKSSILF